MKATTILNCKLFIFYSYVVFTIHLDIYYVNILDKNYAFRKVKTTCKLKKEYVKIPFALEVKVTGDFILFNLILNKLIMKMVAHFRCFKSGS